MTCQRYVMGKPKPVTVFGATFNKIGARDNIKTGDWQSETVVEKPIFDVEDPCDRYDKI